MVLVFDWIVSIDTDCTGMKLFDKDTSNAAYAYYGASFKYHRLQKCGHMCLFNWEGCCRCLKTSLCAICRIRMPIVYGINQ